MPVKPDVQSLLDMMEAQGLPPFDEMSVPQARDVAGSFRDMQGEPEQVGEVRDITVPGPAGELPVRVFHPAPGTPLPLLVYFHGGGWVIGNIEIVDKPCRALANASQCVVAAAQYRLAPETKFPGPVEDCYAATRWLAEHAGELGAAPDKVAVGGDSAGGNLAAAVSLMARDRGGPRIDYQLLIYPVTAPARGTQFASYEDNADGYLLTRGAMEWFWDHYLASPEDAENP
ncbi:MAG: alpha/beta hydrolase, partial [Actinomycetota bacterium]|nr:alpha/beta hydrolase [Actinomycetota bacterium]